MLESCDCEERQSFLSQDPTSITQHEISNVIFRSMACLLCIEADLRLLSDNVKLLDGKKDLQEIADLSKEKYKILHQKGKNISAFLGKAKNELLKFMPDDMRKACLEVEAAGKAHLN